MGKAAIQKRLLTPLKPVSQASGRDHSASDAGLPARLVHPETMGLSHRVTLLFLAVWGCPRVSWSLVWYTAWVSTVYTEPGTNRTVRDSAESGRYGNSSPKESAQGLVGIPCGGTAHHMAGCDPKVEYEIPMQPGSSSGEKKAGAPFSSPQSWIALVAHGGCPLKDKVANAARRKAAAVVIYNEPQFGNSTLTSMPYLGQCSEGRNKESNLKTIFVANGVGWVPAAMVREWEGKNRIFPSEVAKLGMINLLPFGQGEGEACFNLK